MEGCRFWEERKEKKEKKKKRKHKRKRKGSPSANKMYPHLHQYDYRSNKAHTLKKELWAKRWEREGGVRTHGYSESRQHSTKDL